MSLCIWHVDRFAAKAGHESGTVTQLSLGRWPAPIDTTHDTDAHFWPYVIYVSGSVSEIQISVKVEQRKAKGLDAATEAVLCHYLVLEYDQHEGLFEHEPFLEKFDKLAADSPLRKFAAFYWTKGGARLIYRLASPIDYQRYEGKVRSLQQMLADETGIECDPTSDEWWRCYRLPRVVRDGKRTWEESYYELVQTEDTIDADSIHTRTQRVTWDGRGMSLSAAPEGMPDEDSALADASRDNVRMGAKKLLKGKPAYAYVFEAAQPAPGERDKTIGLISHSVVKALFGEIEMLTAQQVFGLLLPMVIGIQSDGEPLAQKLWRAVRHSWNAETEKRQLFLQKVEVELDKQEEVVKAVLACWPPSLIPKEEDEKAVWAMKRLAVQTRRGGAHLFDPEKGAYTCEHYNVQTLVPHFRDRFGFLPIRTQGGGLKAGGTLLNDYSTVIGDTIYVGGISKGSAVRIRRGEPCIEVCPHEIRTELMEMAEFNHDIARWLMSMGNEAHAHIVEWLSAFPAVAEGPTAALSLRGPKGCGKTMLALAAAEVFGDTWVSGMEAFSRFNRGLLRSPVIVCDEGLPKKIEGMLVPDAFRTMQSGGAWPIEEKRGDTNMSQINWRFIFTSNSNEVIRSLSGGHVLTRDDTDALAQRVMHIDIGYSAADYLSSKGGRSFTRDWVSGDPRHGGQKLARHILWLYKEASDRHKVGMKQRFLVEGTFDSSLMAALESSGCAPEVALLLCDDIKSAWNNGTSTAIPLRVVGAEDRDPGVWLRKVGWVASAVRRLDKQAKPAEIRRVLDRWVTPRERRFGGTEVYVELRLTEVRNIARSEGIDTAALDSVISMVRDKVAK